MTTNDMGDAFGPGSRSPTGAADASPPPASIPIAVKALSLWQPWASLWARGAKIHETRSWATNYRGPLIVHATKRFERDVDEDLEAILDGEFGGHWGMDLPTGAIVGIVDLIGCFKTETIETSEDDRICGDFHPGRYGWRAENFRLLNGRGTLGNPVPWRGAQGLFEIPTAILPASLRNTLASGIETRRAETAGLGAKPESPVAEGETP